MKHSPNLTAARSAQNLITGLGLPPVTKTPTTLVVTCKAGVNDDELGSIIEYAKSQPCVRGVTFQPVQDAGRADGFDPATGIYVNADGHGEEWERPTSFEILDRDGSGGLQINALAKPWGDGKLKLGLNLTTDLERGEEPNRSSPSSCLPRLISVLVTVLAFLEYQRVTAMMIPARISSRVWEDVAF